MSHSLSSLLRRLLPAAIVLILAAAVTSCSSTRGVTASAVGSSKRSGVSKSSGPSQKSSAKTPGDVWKNKQGGSTAQNKPLERIDFKKMTLNPVSEKLLREADSWIGTAYTFGGNDRSGVDCSGFVVEVFKNSLGISLPRTSAQQHSFCDSISREDLMPGDLVFFTVRGGANVGHVGIYIGNNRMVHSSSSKGVIISSLEANYYVVNYFGSGRVQRYYAMCGGGEKPRPTTTPKQPKPQPAAIPVAQPEPPVYAAVDPEPEVAELEPLAAVITTVEATPSPAVEEELSSDEQAAVKARVAMRVARFGKTQQDKK